VFLPAEGEKPNTSIKPVSFLVNFFDEVKRRSKR